MIQRVCVFCGSSAGARPEYEAAAQAFGRLLAERGLGLVYGGARVGLMGVVADAAISAGGEVVGFMPRALVEQEVAHTGLSRLHVADTMHERKARMYEHADAFVGLPGGLGTFEELFEVWTWAQIGLHRKPVALLDVAGFYRPLTAFLEVAVAECFVRREHRNMLLVDEAPVALLERLARHRPLAVDKWSRGAGE